MPNRKLLACASAVAAGVLAAVVLQDREARVAARPSLATTVARPPAAEPRPLVGASRAEAPPLDGDGEPLGQAAFARLALSAAEKGFLDELARLGPRSLARPLGEIAIGGYHHEELTRAIGAAMDDFAAPRLAALQRDPAGSLRLIESALAAAPLAQPSVAYARATLLSAAAQLPGQRQETSALALRDLTARPLPPLEMPSPLALRAAGERGEAVPENPELPAYTAAALVHSTFLETAADAVASAEGTAAIIRAQPDPSLRLRLARQLLAKYPDARKRLGRSLAAAGVALDLPS